MGFDLEQRIQRLLDQLVHSLLRHNGRRAVVNVPAARSSSPGFQFETSDSYSLKISPPRLARAYLNT